MNVHPSHPLGKPYPGFQRLNYICDKGSYTELNKITLPATFSDWPTTRFEVDFQIISNGTNSWNHIVGAFGNQAAACAVIQQAGVSNSWDAIVRTDKWEVVAKETVTIPRGERYRIILSPTEYTLLTSPGGRCVASFALSTAGMAAGIYFGTPYMEFGNGHIFRFYEVIMSDASQHFHLRPVKECATGRYGLLDIHKHIFLTGHYPERITGA